MKSCGYFYVYNSYKEDMMGKYESIIERLIQDNPEAILWIGFEDALIGMALSFGKMPVALYDYDKCIEILMKDMKRGEAEEYFEFNTLGAYLGEYTPIVLIK